MKVTLRLCDGREMTFLEVENVSILESNALEVAKVPTEGKWFEVNPLAIDENLFKKERRDSKQEETRQLILEAFEEMKKEDSKYAKPFKTLMPEKTWERKNVGELKAIAQKLGDHNADWVEQSLEWAQRIANGEAWEDICNRPDRTKWFRVVMWKDGYYRMVGGSEKTRLNFPASTFSRFGRYNENDHYFVVPLVVLYD